MSSTTTSRVVILLVLSLVCVGDYGLVFVSGVAPRYKAMFSFGDSLADTGNFIIAGAMRFSAIEKLPYGMTYFGKPTGRCSDGRLVVDFLAQAFGLPLLPPYLKSGQSFQQGVNFAFAGATALDVAFLEREKMGTFRWSNNSLGVQLKWFQQLKPSLCKTPLACKELFGKSLFLVGEIGGNDYNYGSFSGKTAKELKTYVPNIIGVITSTIQTLINEGAKEVLVPGLGPLGCSALYLSLFGTSLKEDYDSRDGCLKEFNSLSKYHNTVLLRELTRLRTKYPNVKIIYGDYYKATIEIAHAPQHHGFHDHLNACCGGGGAYNMNLSAWCGNPGSTVCREPNAAANWDGIHLTDAAYNHIATGLLKGPYASPPF